MALEILSRSDEPIRSLDDWLTLAPPKEGDAHWKDGRSAKELAKAWLGGGNPAVPKEVHDLLESHPATRDFEAERAWPERITALDDHRGGQRNHDLMVVGTANGVPTLLGVEGKADETFGQTIAERLTAARAQERSNLPARMAELCRAVLGKELAAVEDDPALSGLRYQLLHALAGTLIEAGTHGCAQAVLVIHEFRTGETRPERITANARDLDRFVSTLAGSGSAGGDGTLAGPFAIPGSEGVPGDIPFLVGKASR